MDVRSVSLSSFETFGSLLKYLRRRAQLTQRELAIAVGYSESLISRLEADQRVPDLVLQIVNLLIEFVFISVLFALIYQYVPDAKIAWKDVWLGAAFTTLLFTIGKQVIGLYLGNSNIISAYGIFASLIVLLIWVYYFAQIMLFGAEFTQVHANLYGSHIVPTENAEMVTEVVRANEGIPHQETLKYKS